MWEALVALWDLLVLSGGFLVQAAILVGAFFRALLPLLPGGLWCAWWLWCVNWTHAWPVLRKGGWIAAVLVTFASALAWSGVSPSSCDCLGFPLPNFWWQLGACSTLAVVALFCGFLQGRFGLTPAEVNFDPPAHDDHHGHGHH